MKKVISGAMDGVDVVTIKNDLHARLRLDSDKQRKILKKQLLSIEESLGTLTFQKMPRKGNKTTTASRCVNAACDLLINSVNEVKTVIGDLCRFDEFIVRRQKLHGDNYRKQGLEETRKSERLALRMVHIDHFVKDFAGQALDKDHQEEINSSVRDYCGDARCKGLYEKAMKEAVSFYDSEADLCKFEDYEINFDVDVLKTKTESLDLLKQTKALYMSWKIKLENLKVDLALKWETDSASELKSVSKDKEKDLGLYYKKLGSILMFEIEKQCCNEVLEIVNRIVNHTVQRLNTALDEAIADISGKEKDLAERAEAKARVVAVDRRINNKKKRKNKGPKPTDKMRHLQAERDRDREAAATTAYLLKSVESKNQTQIARAEKKANAKASKNSQVVAAAAASQKEADEKALLDSCVLENNSFYNNFLLNQEFVDFFTKHICFDSKNKFFIKDLNTYIERGVDVNSVDTKGWSALHHAIYHNQEAVVRILLSANASITLENDEGNNALRMTVVETILDRDRMSMCKYLLNNDHQFGRYNGVDINHPDKDKFTVLMLAIQECKPDIVDQLIRLGSTVEALAYGCSPLCLAAQSNCEKSVELLLKAGADVNFKHVSPERVFLNDFDIQCSLFDGSTALIPAVQSGNIEIVKLLLEANANLEPKTILGYTPLLIAAHFNYESILRLLLNKGADVNVVCNKGYNILQYSSDHPHITSLLTSLVGGGDSV